MGKILIILVICLFLLIGCKEQETEIANPASVNCEEQGGELEIITEPDNGQYGICVFEKTNSFCEEWQLFREECKEGDLIYCKESDADFCYTLYEPVCGLQTDREFKTFSNDCVACKQGAIGYKMGECENEK